MVSTQYKRILVKFSGESVAGDDDHGIDPKILDNMAASIRDCKSLDVEIGIVIGGGNLFRGEKLNKAGMDRVAGDHMGMLATVMNGIALRDSLERAGLKTRVMSAIPMEGLVEHYDRRLAIQLLNDGYVVIFTAGTGNPFFTTDTAGCLRAIETQSDLMLKATRVDGVFDSDPEINKNAKFFKNLSFDEAIVKNLKVMDSTALTLARDHKLPIKVFNTYEPDALRKIICGEDIGTLISWIMNEIINTTSERMQKSISSLKFAFNKIRTGRASPSLLDDIKIDYYGNPTPLNQTSNISVEDNRSLVISPWDKTLIPEIEKAIIGSDLGLNPSTASDLIRISLPALTEETRQTYIKQARSEAENTRVSIRNIRRDSNSILKDKNSNGEISEDELRRGEDLIQKETDLYISQVDLELKNKEADLLEI